MASFLPTRSDGRQNPYAGNFFKYNTLHSVPFPADNFFSLPTYPLSDVDNVDRYGWDLHPVLPARFMQKVRMVPDGCWEWTGWVASNRYYPEHRYGCVKYRTADGRRRSTSAHRFAYILIHGSIPDDYDVDHLCHNKLCVNPTHLEAVTHQENILRIPENRKRRTPEIARRAALARWSKRNLLTSLLLVALLTPAPHRMVDPMFVLSEVARKSYGQFSLDFETLVTSHESKTEVMLQSSPALETGALPPTLDQLAKKYRLLIDRVMARLSEAEQREINTHYQADYRQSWICLSFANRGIAQPFVEASYQMYGIHPSKVWERIVADRKERLGREYYDFYDSADVLRPDVPHIPPRTTTAAHGAGAFAIDPGSVPHHKEVV